MKRTSVIAMLLVAFILVGCGQDTLTGPQLVEEDIISHVHEDGTIHTINMQTSPTGSSVGSQNADGSWTCTGFE